MRERLSREIVAACLLGALLAVTSGCLIDPPGPGPGPGPNPQPGPIKTDKLVVLVIHESADAMPRPQQAVMNSPALRAFVQQAGGTMLAIDKDADLSRADQWVKDGLAAERAGLPWLIVGSKNGSVGVPLPDTIEKVQEIVRKYQ